MRYVLVRVVVVVLFVATFAAALVVVTHALHTDALHVLDHWQEWWGRLLELSQLFIEFSGSRSWHPLGAR
jgi:hypothetical protein